LKGEGKIMANICMTDIVFVVNHENEKDLKEFHKELSKLPKEIKLNNQKTYGNNWLGNVCVHFGLDWEEYPCRGKLMSVDKIKQSREAFHFYIKIEEVGSPKPKMWEKILKDWKNIKMFILAEEGDSVFINTDTSLKYFDERYLVELIVENEDIEILIEGKGEEYREYIKKIPCFNYFKTFEEVKSFVGKLTNKKIESKTQLDKTLALLRDKNIDIFSYEFATELE